MKTLKERRCPKLTTRDLVHEMKNMLMRNELDTKWYSVAISLAAQNGTSEAYEMGKAIREMFGELGLVAKRA